MLVFNSQLSFDNNYLAFPLFLTSLGTPNILQLSFHLVKYKTHFHCKLITEKNKKVINRSGLVATNAIPG